MRSFSSASLLFAAACLAPAGAASEGASATVPLERGHVVVHKRVKESVLVQGQPFEVAYTIMNIGAECVARAMAWPCGSRLEKGCAGSQVAPAP